MMNKMKPAFQKYFSDFKMVFHCMLHPFKGFWELKRDKRANSAVSLTMLILFVLSGLIYQQFAAYSFNVMAVWPEDINIFSDTLMVVLVVALWCYSNWGITTLFNGEGSVKDIYHYTAYSLMPYIIFTLVLTALSHVMSVDEASIFTFLNFLGTFWTGILLYSGTMVTHQYGAIGTFFSILAIVFGMVLLVFIGMLFFFLLQQIIGVVYTIYRELTMRY